MFVPTLSFGQVLIKLTESNKSEFEKAKQNEAELSQDPTIKKDQNKIKIETTKGKAIKFEDDLSDENYRTFEYFGDLIKNKIVLVKTQDYNTDRYIAVNLSNGGQTTMIGVPHILGNDIICLQGQETDVKQVLEFWRYERGELIKIKTFTFPNETYPAEVVWLDSHQIIVQAYMGRFWKATVDGK
jgi:hypothetical protein